MLSSSKRLTISLFKTVMDKGKIFHSPFFSAKILKVDGISRFSVAVSKKVAKNAVDRNKIRRRVYSSLRSLDSKISPGVHAVFMVKSAISTHPFSEITSFIESFFVKTGLMK